jgi:hypothetical protein
MPLIQDKNEVQHHISNLLFIGLTCGCLMLLFTKFFGSEKIRGPNSSHKTGPTRENYSLFINMSKVLSTGNVRLFLNILLSCAGQYFSCPCHGVSSVSHIRLVIGFNTKFFDLTHLIKLIQQERVAHSL